MLTEKFVKPHYISQTDLYKLVYNMLILIKFGLEQESDMGIQHFNLMELIPVAWGYSKYLKNNIINNILKNEINEYYNFYHTCTITNRILNPFQCYKQLKNK